MSCRCTVNVYVLKWRVDTSSQKRDGCPERERRDKLKSSIRSLPN